MSDVIPMKHKYSPD